MKISFNYDTNKFKALELYAEPKGININTELVQAMDALYQKHVPGNVKAFIQAKSAGRRGKENLQDSSSSAVGNESVGV